MSSSSSFLSIIVDLDSLVTGLAHQSKKYDLNFFIVSLTTFCSSYCLLNRSNRLSIITYSQNGIDFIFPNNKSTVCNSNYDYIPSMPDLVRELVSAFSCSVQNYAASLDVERKQVKNSLSSALSTSLTIMNKHFLSSHVLCRILNIQFDKDGENNYNSIMNSIFSAQKMSVVIDSLVLSSFDSHIMQQACFLSGGLYMKHVEWGDILILLQSYFLSDSETRQSLLTPHQKTVDFKASCFCHKKPVEFAYMCTICLTLLCDVPHKNCPVCEISLRSNQGNE